MKNTFLGNVCFSLSAFLLRVTVQLKKKKKWDKIVISWCETTTLVTPKWISKVSSLTATAVQQNQISNFKTKTKKCAPLPFLSKINYNYCNLAAFAAGASSTTTCIRLLNNNNNNSVLTNVSFPRLVASALSFATAHQNKTVIVVNTGIKKQDCQNSSSDSIIPFRSMKSKYLSLYYGD